MNDYTHAVPLMLPLGPLNLNAANISGDLHMKPLTANMNLEVRGAPMDFLTSYLSDNTNLHLDTGTLNLDGKIDYKEGNITFSGNSKISDFSLKQNTTESEALSWKNLDLNSILFSTTPMTIHISEVAFDNLKTAIILNADGTLNIKNYLKPKNVSKVDKTVKESPKEAETKFNYDLKNITFSNGEIDVADKQVQPNFAARVRSFSGKMAPITHNPENKIQTDLSGLIEDFDRFKGHGYLIPGTTKPTLDLKMNFHNIELTTFTPYAGEFAGYEIQQGKLFLDLKYTMVKNRIRGENAVPLDQFKLGDKVESEHSSNWPVKLALALMKDRSGQIKFQLPVEGDVSSPSFSFSNLIWTTLKNMVINIVAAPFDFLASLVGGDKEMQFILFDAGTLVLLKNESSKIQKIALALTERPQLAVEIQGHFSEQDFEHFRKAELDTRLASKSSNKVKALKSLAYDLLPKDKVTSTLNNLKESHGDDTPEFIAALEKTLMLTIEIPHDIQKNLTLERGKVVQGLLVEAKVSADRVFLLAGTIAEKDTPPQIKLNLNER